MGFVPLQNSFMLVTCSMCSEPEKALTSFLWSFRHLHESLRLGLFLRRMSYGLISAFVLIVLPSGSTSWGWKKGYAWAWGCGKFTALTGNAIKTSFNLDSWSLSWVLCFRIGPSIGLSRDTGLSTRFLDSGFCPLPVAGLAALQHWYKTDSWRTPASSLVMC